MTLAKMVRFLALMTGSLCALSASSLAGQRQITFPSESGNLLGDPSSLAFARDGRVGFAVLVKQSFAATLFSFLPGEGSIVSQVDLTPDFGVKQGIVAPLPSVKAHETGLVLAYGLASDGSQKIVAFASDEAGRLSRRWQLSFPLSPGLFVGDGSQLTFNVDGTRAYIIPGAIMGSENDFNLTLLDTQNGATVASAHLPGDLPRGSVFFDEIHGRAIAASWSAVYVFRPGTDTLDLEAKIESITGPPVFGLGISEDGALVIASFGAALNDQIQAVNQFLVYDLDRHKSVEYDFTDVLASGVVNDFTFHRPTGTLLVPPKAKFSIGPDGGIVETLNTRRRIEAYTLGPDGSFTRTLDFQLAKFSQDSSAPNGVGLFSTIVVSKTGALGFVPSVNGRLFTFDVATGEIVGDDSITPWRDGPMIQLLETRGLLTIATGTNVLGIIDISTGPIITDAAVHSRNTTIRGLNFLSGARVQINGTDIGEVTRGPNDPGRQLTINRGKRDFPPGQPFTITVVNRDGAISNAFVLTR